MCIKITKTKTCKSEIQYGCKLHLFVCLSFGFTVVVVVVNSFSNGQKLNFVNFVRKEAQLDGMATNRKKQIFSQFYFSFSLMCFSRVRLAHQLISVFYSYCIVTAASRLCICWVFIIDLKKYCSTFFAISRFSSSNTHRKTSIASLWEKNTRTYRHCLERLLCALYVVLDFKNPATLFVLCLLLVRICRSLSNPQISRCVLLLLLLFLRMR